MFVMGFNLKSIICIVIIGNIFSDVQTFDNDQNTVQLQQSIEHGRDKFPDYIELNFVHEGENVRLSLARDDVTTEYLSETLFETARNLPSNVYTDENSEHFAAYTSPEADLVIHRESNTEPGKAYGGFSKYGEKYVISSIDGSHEHHKVVKHSDVSDMTNVLDISMDREGNVRHKREVLDDNTNVVELFMWADYSIYEHFNESVLTNNTVQELKIYIRDYMRSITKDLDTLFKYMETYGLVHFRIYLTQYQVATKTDHTPWIKNSLTGTTLSTAAAMTHFLGYYANLTSKFDFPNPDHIMILTRYDLDTGLEFYQENEVCGSTTTYSASFVKTYYFPKAMAMALAKAIGGGNITYDGVDNDCEIDSFNVMATNNGVYSPTPDDKQGNYWKFSLCNLGEFKSLLETYNLSCLREQDEFYDFDTFSNYSPYGAAYTADEQCQNQFGSSSTFCNLLDGVGVDCFSGRDGCLDNMYGLCVEYRVGDETPCAGGTLCEYGICLDSGFSTSAPMVTGTTNATQMFSSSPIFPSTTEVMSTNFTFPSSSVDPPSTSPIDPFNSTIFNTTTIETPTTTASSTTSSTSSTASTSTTSLPGGENQTTTSTEPTTTITKCYVKTGIVEFDLPGCGCCGGCGCDATCTECNNGVGRPDFIDNGDNCTLIDDCVPSKVRMTTYWVPLGCPLPFDPDNQTLVIKKLGFDVKDYDVKAKLYQDVSDDWQVDLEVQNPDNEIEGGI